ncbi:MAG: metallophosphatase [Bacteroidaceae bacterium]|nr:metallophosphatase [Bacteroidaceae bacterium]
MKTRYFSYIIVLTLIMFNGQWSMVNGQSTSVNGQSKKLYVLHSSDTHSRIDPIDSSKPGRNAGMGGVTRRAGLVNQFRQEHPDMLLFDCGDISQGTPYYNLYQGEVEVKAMNLMKYDAMTIGNHEFDYGLDNMARLFKMAEFPIVCSNYDFEGTVVEGLVKPYVVLKRNGVKIGVFGLSPQLEGLVQQTKCEGVVYHKPAAVANRMVMILREQEKCDVVICLSHLGIERNPGVDEVYDNVIVPQTHGIDLVLGGHTHTFMEKPEQVKDADGKSVPIMHIGNNGVYMSQTVLTLQKK